MRTKINTVDPLRELLDKADAHLLDLPLPSQANRKPNITAVVGSTLGTSNAQVCAWGPHRAV
jgi:hypothetical protein